MARTRPFICEAHGKLQTVHFDGYDFAERLLEGCLFVATFDENGLGEAIVTPKDGPWENDPYLYKLNKEELTKQAKEHIEESDMAICPECGDDAYEEWDEDDG